MIPTIEQIVEDVRSGKVGTSQAIGWLHQHAEAATQELRDYFAASALQGMIASGNAFSLESTKAAYKFADAMLQARKS